MSKSVSSVPWLILLVIAEHIACHCSGYCCLICSRTTLDDFASIGLVAASFFRGPLFATQRL